MSLTLSGPIKPAFAFDGDSDTSAATVSKLSRPVVTRARIVSAFAFAASSAATFRPLASPGTETRISRSVTVGGVVNSLRCAS
jgi:hypothetical protein